MECPQWVEPRLTAKGWKLAIEFIFMVPWPMLDWNDLMNWKLVFAVMMLIGVGLKIAISDDELDMIVVFLVGGALGALTEQLWQGRAKHS